MIEIHLLFTFANYLFTIRISHIYNTYLFSILLQPLFFNKSSQVYFTNMQNKSWHSWETAKDPAVI